MLRGVIWGFDAQAFSNSGQGRFVNILVLNKKKSCSISLVWFGYYMKDNPGDHFEFMHHNVITNDMNVGKMGYAKFRKL